MATECLAFFLLIRQQRCGGRLLCAAEISNESGIAAVGLAALQFATAVGMDALRVDDADGVSLGVQKMRQLTTIAARGFKTGMDLTRSLGCQPAAEFGKAIGAIAKATELLSLLLPLFT